MKFRSIHKSIYLLFGGLILFVGIGFALMLMKAERESKVFKQNEKNLEEALERVRNELAIQENYLKRFKQDPEFFEWVARQRIGYAKTDEIIFRFGENDVNGDIYNSKKTDDE